MQPPFEHSILALAAFATFTSQRVHALPTDAHVARLFAKRQDLEIGSDEWKAQYPSEDVVPEAKQEWLDALDAVVGQGLIPDIPVATITGDGWPSYSDGVAADDPSRCHYTVGCTEPTDIVDAPDGYIGISQDDGPLPPGRELNAFFETEGIAATHFYIGSNVLENSAGLPDIALQAVGIPNQSLAVHTWTHGYSSSQSNEEIVGEIGWTMQILADINGGRIPAFWRPPYGDVDNRVRAVVREVFGLHTVIWSEDSLDWEIGSGRTVAEVEADLKSLVDVPKSPGLIILEHELVDGCVTGASPQTHPFKSVYPSMVSNNWNLTDIPGLWGLPKYKNALSGESAVVDGIDIANTTAVTLETSPSSSTAPTPTSSKAAPAAESTSSSSVTPASDETSAAPASQPSSVSGTSASVLVLQHPCGSVLALALPAALGTFVAFL